MVSYIGSHFRVSAQGRTYAGEVLQVNAAAEVLTLSVYAEDGAPCGPRVVALRSQDIEDIRKMPHAPPAALNRSSDCDVIVEEEAVEHTAAVPAVEAGKQAVEEVTEGFSRVEVECGKETPANGVALPKAHPASIAILNGNGHKMKKMSRWERKRNNRELEKLRNVDTFGRSATLDPAIMEDFDFEKHNALFDREQFTKEYNEKLQTSNLPDLVNVNAQDSATVVKQNFCDTRKTEEKYRCDENVLQVTNGYLNNRNRRYISLPDCETDGKLYETDTGVQIPCIGVDFRSKLMDTISSCGFSSERLREAVGAGATDLCVTLLGGDARMSASNHNGAPRVVVLCGDHSQGSLGVNTARHLATQGVQVTCVVAGREETADSSVASELTLLKFADAVVARSCAEMDDGSVVDMILDARLDIHGSPGGDQAAHKWAKDCTSWAEKQKCPVLAIDPPPVSNSPPELFLIKTRAVVVGAPLPFNYPQHQDKPYLIRVAIPAPIFENVGLCYTSPFCGKSILGLSRVR